MRKLRHFIISICILSGNMFVCAGNLVQAPLLNDSLFKLQREILSLARKNDGQTHTNLNRILQTYENRYTAQSSAYADCLMWCAMICCEAGDNKQAYKLLKQSNGIFKQYGTGPFEGKDSIHEIFALDIEAKVEYNSDRDFRALQLSRQACQLKKDYFGSLSEVYLMSLLDLSKLYAERLNYRKSRSTHNLGYSSYIQLIKDEFCKMSESQRSLYWETAIKYIGRTIDLAHKSAKKNKLSYEHDLAAAAYNAMLLSKGLLLHTTIEFERFVLNSRNVEAQRLLALKKQLYNQGAEQETLDSLDYRILSELQEDGLSFSIPHLSIRWEDVTAKLNHDDLAIEFYRNSIGEYGAILLKKSWKSPKIVKLRDFVKCRNTYVGLDSALIKISLEDCTPDNIDDMWEISKAVWTNDVLKYFPASKDGKVYFSADGNLLTASIECYPFLRPEDDAKFFSVSDVYNIYRVSSTRMLTVQGSGKAEEKMVLYGGLEYNIDCNEIASNSEPSLPVIPKDTTGTNKRSGSRYSLSYITELDGTKREVETIYKTINGSEHELKPKVVTGREGTEESFKALSAKHNKVIHVATHGFFYNEEEMYQRGDTLLANNPLSRSGLILAGAYNKANGLDINPGVEDAYLTAQEVANLDFNDLDLIVLSACETAKGDISADGVFGLQRGFKMAGAQSILMSLWKVDDDATCLLMTEFYKHWINGKSKRVALEIAKNTVRSHKQWKDPKYWAAFILLDALD